MVVHDEEEVVVVLPSHAQFPVHPREVDHFNEVSALYMGQHRFSDISDQQDLDRLFILETLCYRWGTWLSREKDWDDQPIDNSDVVKWLKDGSAELRQLKKMIGIDKTSRDRSRGEDSTETYLTNLRIRAKAFGVMRETQGTAVITLFQDLSKLITLHDNCDERDRREQHVTIDDIIEWIREVAIPEFEKVDAYFREHEQRAWIRSQ